jgi:inner membrane protein
MAWWLWIVAGCALAVLEILMPAFVFLGFAIGAVLTGIIDWLGLPAAEWMAGSLPRHLLVFAVLSLLAWLALVGIFGLKRGQVKTWDKDINDN